MAVEADRVLLIPISERIFLTQEQAGALLGISGRQIRRLVAAGEIRQANVGRAARIHRSEVDRYAQTLWAQQHGLEEVTPKPRRKAAAS